MSDSIPNQLEVACPTCNKTVIWNEQQKWRPFCSKRCRLIDLGEWADEGHRISGESLPPGMPEDQ